MEQSFMKERPIFPLVLSMSIPMVLSMLVNALYNIVDGLFVARISEDAMAAISLLYPIQNVTIALSVGFGIGVNAVISFHLGSRNLDLASKTGSTGMALSALHGLIFGLLGYLVLPHFLGMFSKDTGTLQMGQEYGAMVFAFAVPYSMSLVMEKIFQSCGRMKTSMAVMMTGCLFNIIMDPVLIFGFGPIPALGIRGAALATGMGQALTLVIYAILYRKNPIPVTLSPKQIHVKAQVLKRMYGVGVPAALNIGLPSLLVSALNSILSGYPQSYVLIVGIYYKLQTFVYLPANGIIQGIRPLVGYNYGAGETQRVRKIFKVSLILTSGIMLVGMALCWLLPSQLVTMFAPSPETLEVGTKALPIMSLGFLVSAISITASGTLEGLGKGPFSLVIALLRNVVIMIPLAYVLSRIFGADGVWQAFWITETCTAAAAYGLYQKALKPKHS